MTISAPNEPGHHTDRASDRGRRLWEWPHSFDRRYPHRQTMRALLADTRTHLSLLHSRRSGRRRSTGVGTYRSRRAPRRWSKVKLCGRWRRHRQHRRNDTGDRVALAGRAWRIPPEKTIPPDMELTRPGMVAPFGAAWRRYSVTPSKAMPNSRHRPNAGPYLA